MNFHVTECLLHDPMHLLFEGVTCLQLTLLLNHIIFENKYVSFSFVSERLKELAQNLVADCRPNAIDVNEIKSSEKSLRQTAHQIWWLSNLLPIAVGEKIPFADIRWKNFIRLLQIQQLCTSPIAMPATVLCLKVLVARHNKSFQDAYPQQSFIPKLHYLTHLPQQIEKFGPARNHWCTRFEAKNGLFKQNKLRNFKNVPKTLAFLHQRWNSYMQCESDCEGESRFLKLPLCNKSGNYIE